MEVVGDEREAEPGHLREPGVLDEIERQMLLAGERVADLHRDAFPTWNGDVRPPGGDGR